MKQKSCTCVKPKLTQELPLGFKGKVVCAECKGMAEYPLKEAKYTGNDPVEGYLFSLGQHSSNMTFEKAVLVMLLRIEKSLQKPAPVSDKGKK